MQQFNTQNPDVAVDAPSVVAEEPVENLSIIVFTEEVAPVATSSFPVDFNVSFNEVVPVAHPVHPPGGAKSVETLLREELAAVKKALQKESQTNDILVNDLGRAHLMWGQYEDNLEILNRRLLESQNAATASGSGDPRPLACKAPPPSVVYGNNAEPARPKGSTLHPAANVPPVLKAVPPMPPAAKAPPHKAPPPECLVSPPGAADFVVPKDQLLNGRPPWLAFKTSEGVPYYFSNVTMCRHGISLRNLVAGPLHYLRTCSLLAAMLLNWHRRLL